jgi:hypothetical protein
MVTVPIPAQVFRLARRASREVPPYRATVATVRATVAGGPTLDRALDVPSLAAGAARPPVG